MHGPHGMTFIKAREKGGTKCSVTIMKSKNRIWVMALFVKVSREGQT
jgi:hypothetical protein